MKKIRVYNLAKELKVNVEKILKDINQLGINKVQVPSNAVNKNIADIIRAKYSAVSNQQSTFDEANKLKPKIIKKDLKENNQKDNDSNSKTISINKPLTKNIKVEIILESKKAKRVNEKGNCKRCGALSKVLWRYSQSNIGIVNLCSHCKVIVYGKSFGNADAMTVAYQGGQFESNRRKH